MVRELVAKPIVAEDTDPGLVGDGLYVGAKEHAADVSKLVRLGVTHVLNCAPSGIPSLPLNEYREKGIRYGFTNVKRDDSTYPILHDEDQVRSTHLDAAKAFFDAVQREGGKALFFCVAGQNRSATLAVAVLLLNHQSLQKVLLQCSVTRSFILENEGFQRQLVELEAWVITSSAEDFPNGKKRLLPSGHQIIERPHRGKRSRIVRKESSARLLDAESGVEVELRVPGLACFDVQIPIEATIEDVKQVLIERANKNLREEYAARVGKAWLVFTMFGTGIEFGLVLEQEAVEACVQIARLHNTFSLDIIEGDTSQASIVRWTPSCRFELVIFSILDNAQDDPEHKPFTFRHEERRGVPGTLLVNNNIETHLRAWDFVSGGGFRSKLPIVFTFAEDARNKRDFRDVSINRGMEPQCYKTPEESSILGMGANAIVHRVQLQVATPSAEGEAEMPLAISRDVSLPLDREWDAAVKRPFTVAKMLSAMGHKSEAGMAKRLRMAAALNRHERLLYFYGLGIALSSNEKDREEFKFELTLLSRYQEDFSTYTLKKFLDDYTAALVPGEPLSARTAEVRRLQDEFSLMKVKVLLVSLLNGFRDLTLMGIQAFDFNHLDNVLISRDARKARLIDIDGSSKGSIQFPSEYIEGCAKKETTSAIHMELHKPALDVDLAVLLPLVMQQLTLGKGRGKAFVTDQVSKIWRARDEDAKDMIKAIMRENFFSHAKSETEGMTRHLSKVTEWLFALLRKREPWAHWTKDIYEAMRCIDHLPIG
mmetsp:Transcript_71441/g.201692  ORF Transcript_71441/g.201692 Transcript_71441/m.201692 type:complete len:767 (+) Transcript_71441:3-2303(+)